jgi:class 3 adenylate cyclase/predicted ATPase
MRIGGPPLGCGRLDRCGRRVHWSAGVTLWACSACGGDNPEGTRFCGHCGAPADTAWACPSCGADNPPGTRFCGHCGAPAGAAATATAITTTSKPADADVAEALKRFVASPVADRLLEAGGQLPDERRLITSLFADVSGFTPLSERLDPEQLVEVIDPLITALSAVVGKYEGVVDKYAGDALLALFGAPISHEDDPERALHVALEMHSALEQMKQDLPHGDLLSLHIGVNSGHAIARVQGSEVRMDYNVLGDAVNLAQRLESVAPSGETYVSEPTYRLTKHRFDFDYVGELTLKGKSEPVPGWRLIGERVQALRSDGGLIGRDAEVAVLTDAVDALGRGTGSVLVVAGEAGVGKSRLAAEVHDIAPARGVRWLGTRCLSYGASLAYWPFSALLRAERDLIDAADSEARPFLGRVLGEAQEAVDELEPEAFRRALHGAVASALTQLAQRQPVLLAIEDVHWADPSSLALIGDLASACAGEAVMLLLATRPDALPSLRELVPEARKIELEPLGEDAVEAMITRLLAGPPPDGLARSVAERTGGNPLFVEEIVASLRDVGTLFREGESWTMEAGWDAVTLPNSIEKVLAARIDLLPRATATVLQEASVIGRRMRVELLMAVAADVPDVVSRIAELVEKGFLDKSADDGADVVSFHHALIVDAAYGRLLRRTRREMHLRVAEVGEGLFGVSDDNIDLLARHYYLGGAGEKAVHFLVRAGERDKRLFANDEAILNFSRAVEVAPDNAGIKLELADLHELVGSYDEALQLYEEVRDATSDVRAWRGIASTLRKRGEYADALAAIDEAFATEALKGEDLVGLWLEQGRTLQMSGRPQEALDVLQAGIAAANGRRDASVAQLMFQIARILTLQGEAEAALGHALAAEEIFAEQEDLRGLAASRRALGDIYRYLGRLDDAAAALRQGLSLAERMGNVEEIGGCLLNLGIVEAARARREDALGCFRRAVDEFEAIGHASGRALAYNNLAYMLTLCEEYDEALPYCDRALEIARSIGNSFATAVAYDTMASIALARGDYDEAIVRGEEAAAIHLELGGLADAAQALEVAGAASEKAGDVLRARSLREQARSLTVSEPV